jgi:hypothetical protein
MLEFIIWCVCVCSRNICGRMCCPIGYHEYELGVNMGYYKFTVEGHKYNYNITKDIKVTNALTQLNRIQWSIDNLLQRPSAGGRTVSDNPIRKQPESGFGRGRNLNDSFRSQDSMEAIQQHL